MDIAPWTGINSSYRPCKNIDILGIRRKRPPIFLLLSSILFVVPGSYIPALVLSYFSGSIGFGCRCLAWSLILSAWLLSVALDALLKLFITSTKTLWKATVAKDALVSVFVVGLILAVQVGVLNSCYCRGNMISHTTSGINLGPFGDVEWARNWRVWPAATVSCFAIMLSFGYVLHVVELGAGDGGAPVKLVTGVLCQGKTDMEEDLQELERMTQESLTTEGEDGVNGGGIGGGIGVYGTELRVLNSDADGTMANVNKNTPLRHDTEDP
jgi:hypothetical protein